MTNVISYTQVSDANEAIRFGLYRVAGSGSNIPSWGGGVDLLVLPYENGVKAQVAIFNSTKPKLAIRAMSNGTYGNWIEYATKDDFEAFGIKRIVRQTITTAAAVNTWTKVTLPSRVDPSKSVMLDMMVYIDSDNSYTPLVANGAGKIGGIPFVATGDQEIYYTITDSKFLNHTAVLSVMECK